MQYDNLDFTGNRIVIFLIEQAAQILSNNTEWNTYGTFKSFLPAYNRGKKHDTTMCIYIFLRIKLKKVTKQLFKRITLDFE